MNKFKHTEFNAITGETIVVEERPYTQAELDQQAQDKLDKQNQIILNELAQLDIIVSRVEEDLIAFTQMPVYTTKQAVIARKIELRNLLK